VIMDETLEKKALDMIQTTTKIHVNI
jgi:hypothetical protein